MSEVEMIAEGIRVNPVGKLWEDPRIVVLREKHGNQLLGIQVGPKEADAIGMILNNVSLPEPQTHDFVCAIIDVLGASVKSVNIYKFVNLAFRNSVMAFSHCSLTE